MFDRLISVAPMMGYTDRHCRYLLRLVSGRVLLYTPMITCGALLHGKDRANLLDYSSFEKPLALQLGGCEPEGLAVCARMGEDWEYDEINLNAGCPSHRVSSGHFGAALMREPHLVADCIAAMQDAVSIPVTVKIRIGIDECDDYAFLKHFVRTVAGAGCEVFIIHARKVWSKGLNPRQNRAIPPLCHERVYQLKREFPQLSMVTNGGIETSADVSEHLAHVDGVMIGRAVYANPFLLHEIEQSLGQASSLSRVDVLGDYLQYVQKQLSEGARFSAFARHLMGLFHGCPGAAAWRRLLSA